MVKETIVLDPDIKECEELWWELDKIMKAYYCLPELETIHTNSGNKLLSTSGCNRKALFAEAFNDRIIKYVTKPAKSEEDTDEW